MTTSSTTLADLAVTYPAAARVFYRNGLDFCCGGRRPLADACAARGLDAEALIADIETESATVADKRRWDEEPLDTLINFIVDTYHRRLRETFPDLIRMAARVEDRHADKPGVPARADHAARVDARSRARSSRERRAGACFR